MKRARARARIDGFDFVSGILCGPWFDWREHQNLLQLTFMGLNSIFFNLHGSSFGFPNQL